MSRRTAARLLLAVLLPCVTVPARAGETQDPWRVAHRILREEGVPAARAYAANREDDTAGRLAAFLATKRPLETLDAIERLREAAAVHLRAEAPIEAIRVLGAAGRKAAEAGWTQAMNACFEQAARRLHLAADAEEALRLLEAWRRHADRLGEARARVLARAHHAMLLRRAGRADEADPLLAEAAQIAEAEGGPFPRAVVARVRSKIAFDRRDLASALRESREAATLFAQAGRERRALTLRVQQAAILREMGRLQDSLVRANALAEEATRRGWTGEAANALTAVGAAHLGLGSLAEAFAAFEQADRLAEGAKRMELRVTALLGLTSAYARVGERERSAEAAERALVLARKAGPIPAQILSLIAVAEQWLALGDRDAALEKAEQAHALATSHELRYHALRALLARAALLSRAGDREAALALYREITEQAHELGIPALRIVALANVARKLNEVRREAEAVEVAGEAAALARRYGLREYELTATVERAHAAFFVPNNVIAFEALQHAAELVPEVYGGLAGRQAALARSSTMLIYQFGAHSAVTLGAPSWFWRYLELARGVSLVEALEARARVGFGVLPSALREAEERLRREEEQRVRELGAALAAGKRRPIRAARQALDATRAKLRTLRESIQRELKERADVYFVDPVPYEKAVAALEPGEAILYYGVDPGVPSLALRVTRKDHVLTRLAKVEVFEAALEAGRFHDPSGEPTQALETLRRELIEPLALDETVRRVYVIADGALCYAPFSALLPEREVVYLPSGTSWFLLQAQQGKRGEGVLALGNPEYGAERPPAPGAKRRASRGGIAFRLAPLPETAVEARSVGDTVLLGAEANELAFTRALGARGRWRAVHLACHGLVDTENPLDSALALSKVEGADGFLTGAEAERLEVHADLVTLSACETGRGRVVRGEGILGLTRAFMLAGAPRVLVSLWKVDDAATRALMTAFYDRFDPKGDTPPLSAAAALRAAQAEVRKNPEWKHPYYWAAWTLWGLGR